MGERSEIEIDGERAMDLLAATEIVRAQPGVLRVARAWQERKWLLYDGDTTVDQLVVGDHAILVDGDLTVGFLRDASEVDSSLWVVTGSLHAGSVAQRSAGVVGGDMVVDDTFFADSWGNATTFVGGDLRARCAIVSGHWVEVGGQVDVGIGHGDAFEGCAVEYFHSPHEFVQPQFCELDIWGDGPEERDSDFLAADIVSALMAGDSILLPEVSESASASSWDAKVVSPEESERRVYLEFVGGTSSKFWEVRVDGADLLIRYGRIGSDGRTQRKSFSSEKEARGEASGLAAAKKAKGYVEITPEGPSGTGAMPTFAEYVTQHRERLARLPYAREEALDHLAELIVEADAQELLGASGTLQGRSPFYRHVALDFLATTRRENRREEATGSAISGTRLFTGDLHVDGHLENGGVIIALGDLTIDGNYVALKDHPCLYVGGSFVADGVYMKEAETICNELINARDVMILVYNHTVTIADSIETPLLITDDAGVDAELLVDRHETNDLTTSLATYFGLDAGEFDDPEIAREEIVEAALRHLLE